MGAKRRKPERLAGKLLQIRFALGLSQDGMLERLDFPEEFTRTRISAFESGKREPSLLVLLKYAQCVSISTDVLIDDKQNLPAWLTKAAKAEAASRGPLQRARRRGVGGPKGR